MRHFSLSGETDTATNPSGSFFRSFVQRQCELLLSFCVCCPSFIRHKVYTFKSSPLKLLCKIKPNFAAIVYQGKPILQPTSLVAFLEHLSKGCASFCHHLASVILPSYVIKFAYLNLLLCNPCAKLSQTLLG